MERSVGIEARAGNRAAGQRADGVGAVEDGGFYFCGGRLGVHRRKQPRHTRHVGRRHGRSAVPGVTVAGHGRVDRHARRTEINGGRSVAGEVCQIVVVVGGCNGNDVIVGVVGGIVAAHVVVGAAVACGGDEQDARLIGRGNRIGQGRGVSAASPTVIGGDDVDAEVASHHRHIVNGLDGAGRRAIAACGEELHRHQLRGPVDARNTGRIVADGSDRPGDVRAVAMVVVGIAVTVDEVVPVDIVDVPVAVIVDPVAGDLSGIDPHIGSEVRMRIVDARINNGDHHVGGSGRQVPRFRGVDVGVGEPACLAGVIQPPQGREPAVIRHGRLDDIAHRVDKIGLDVHYAGRRIRPCGEIFIGGVRNGDGPETVAAEALEFGIGESVGAEAIGHEVSTDLLGGESHHPLLRDDLSEAVAPLHAREVGLDGSGA